MTFSSSWIIRFDHFLSFIHFRSTAVAGIHFRGVNFSFHFSRFSSHFCFRFEKSVFFFSVVCFALKAASLNSYLFSFCSVFFALSKTNFRSLHNVVYSIGLCSPLSRFQWVCVCVCMFVHSFCAFVWRIAGNLAACAQERRTEEKHWNEIESNERRRRRLHFSSTSMKIVQMRMNSRHKVSFGDIHFYDKILLPQLKRQEIKIEHWIELCFMWTSLDLFPFPFTATSLSSCELLLLSTFACFTRNH